MPSGSEAATGCNEARWLRDGYELESTSVPPALGSTTTSIAVGDEAVWFVGDSSTVLWRIDPVNVTILNSFEIGTKPQRGGRRGRRGRVGRRSFGHLALAPGSQDERRPRRSGSARRSGGLVAAFGRIWTSPEAIRGVARRFRFANGALPFGDGRRVGSRCSPSVRVSPCSCRPLPPVRTASRRAAARSGSCGA